MSGALPIVLINLDRSRDRLARMQVEFDRAGMTFERFPAVEGTNLPSNVRSYFCNADGKLVCPLSPGEIGAYGSHLSVWQRIAAGQYGAAALVCEDDIHLPDGIAELLREVIAQAPAGWDLIRLSPNTKRAVVPIRPIGHQYNLVRYSSDPASAAAYLLSHAGAAKLLAPGLRSRPVDYEFKRPWAYELQSFGIWPIMIQDDVRGASTIDARGGRARKARRVSRWLPLDVLRRPVYGIRTLGPATWTRCAVWNLVGRKLERRPAPAIIGGA